MKKLSELLPNEEAIVKNMQGDEQVLMRLLSLGLCKDVKISCLYNNANEIMAYKVKNTIFALRKKDASNIEVDLC